MDERKTVQNIHPTPDKKAFIRAFSERCINKQKVVPQTPIKLQYGEGLFN